MLGTLQTNTGKVRAHIGIYEHDMADNGTKQACDCNATHDANVEIGSKSSDNRYGPTYTEVTGNAPNVTIRNKYVKNADLKRQLHKKCKLGFSSSSSYFDTLAKCQ